MARRELPENRDNFAQLIDKFNSYGAPYDVIGQSYYPWWHGSLLDLRDNMNGQRELPVLSIFDKFARK